MVRLVHWLYSASLVLAIFAVVVGDIDHTASRILWTGAVSAALVAVCLLFSAPLSYLLSVTAITLVVAVVWIVAVPRWLRDVFGITVAAIWACMYIWLPARRRLFRRRLE